MTRPPYERTSRRRSPAREYPFLCFPPKEPSSKLHRFLMVSRLILTVLFDHFPLFTIYYFYYVLSLTRVLRLFFPELPDQGRSQTQRRQDCAHELRVQRAPVTQDLRRVHREGRGRRSGSVQGKRHPGWGSAGMLLGRLVLGGYSTRWEWYSGGWYYVRMVLDGNGSRWEWYSVRMILSGNGTKQEWYLVRMVLGGNGTPEDGTRVLGVNSTR